MIEELNGGSLVMRAKDDYKTVKGPQGGCWYVDASAGVPHEDGRSGGFEALQDMAERGGTSGGGRRL